MAPIRSVQTPGTVTPVGHYSQAIVHDGLVYVSGQIPSDLATGKPRGGAIEEQTELALGNVGRILEAAGSGLDRILQMTVYVARIEDWAAVNATYARIMGSHRPARAIVPVSPLHFDLGVEIQAIAALRRAPARTRRAPAGGRTRRRAPRGRNR